MLNLLFFTFLLLYLQSVNPQKDTLSYLKQ